MPAWGPSTTAYFVAASQIGLAVGLPDEVIEFKFVHGIAGFLGAIISLAITPYPSFFRSAAVLVAGFASGMFLAPIVQQYFEIEASHGYAIGLLFGVVAMPFFAGVHALATRWKSDPLGTIQAIRGKGKPDG